MKGNFQIIIIVVFIALAVFGVFVFSGAIPLGGENSPGGLGTVVLWGTQRATVMSPILENFNDANPSLILRYVEKPAGTFDRDLLEALASGTGPDLVLMPDDLIFNYANKLTTVPYESYPLSAFKNNFAGAGEVFLNSAGILAFPLSIDPLVMYYNRSMLDGNQIVYPPEYWDEVLEMAPLLTVKDEANRIIKSAVAMGHFANVNHAKDILTALIMQTGNPIIEQDNGVLRSSLGRVGQGSGPASALKFFVDFADPNQAIYSWNRSFANSGDAFSKEDLAFYFGYASELDSLVSKNPNQNFLIAPFPQVREANFKLTRARLVGVSILASSRNLNTAFIAANLMASGDFAREFALATSTVPPRRDLLNAIPSDAYSAPFYSSALYARSFLDPDPEESADIFRRMVEGVMSNNMTIAEAISDAGGKLNILLSR